MNASGGTQNTGRQFEEAIKILVVDDNEALATATVKYMKRNGIEATSATSAIEGLRVLKQSECDIDCVVSDYRMPNMDGIDLLKTIKRIHPELPVIFFTGKGSEGVASEALSLGLTDYLKKEVPDCYGALALRIETVVERQREVAELWEAQTQFKRLVNSIEEYAVIFLDEDGKIDTWNPGAERLTGYESDETVGKHAAKFYTGEDERRIRYILQRVKGDNESLTTELYRTKRSGGEVRVRETLSPVFNSQGAFEGYSQVSQKIPHDSGQVVHSTESPNEAAEQSATIASPEGKRSKHPASRIDDSTDKGPLSLVRARDAQFEEDDIENTDAFN